MYARMYIIYVSRKSEKSTDAISLSNILDQTESKNGKLEEIMSWYTRVRSR